MFDLMNSEAEAREVEFVMSNGDVTGFYLSLRHESCKEVRAVEKKYRAKYMEAAKKARSKGKTNNINEEMIEERRLAHVAGWRFKDDSPAHIGGERPAFSKEGAKALLSANGIFPYELRNFIDEQVGDANDFLESVESN